MVVAERRGLSFARRYRVVSAAAPWVTAQNAPNTQSCTFKSTVSFHSLNEIGGATGGEAATAPRSAEEMQRAADKALVEAHGKDEHMLQHALFSMLRSRRICLMKSRSSCSYDAVAACIRGMMTTQRPVERGSPCARRISRTRRRSRLRTTACPNLRVVMMPKRDAAGGHPLSAGRGRGAELSTRKRPAADEPSARTMANSEARFMVWRRVSFIVNRALFFFRQAEMAGGSPPPRSKSARGTVL